MRGYEPPKGHEHPGQETGLAIGGLIDAHTPSDGSREANEPPAPIPDEPAPEQEVEPAEDILDELPPGPPVIS